MESCPGWHSLAWSDDPTRIQMRGSSRNQHRHGRASAQLTARRDAASMQFNQLLNERKPDTGSFMCSCLRGSASEKALENPRQIFFGDSTPTVLHFELDVIGHHPLTDSNFPCER